MKGIVKLAVLAALIYLGFTYGRPWIERAAGGAADKARSDSMADGNGDDGGVFSCLDAARGANDALSGAVTVFRSPPYDQGSWSNLESRVSSRVSDARSSCSCVHDACDKAGEALEAIDSLLGYYADAATGDGALIDAARYQQEIDELLGEARSAAGG